MATGSGRIKLEVLKSGGGSDREEIKPNRIRNISQVRESEAQVKEKRGGELGMKTEC